MLWTMSEEMWLQSYRKRQHGAGWRTSSYIFTQVDLTWLIIVVVAQLIGNVISRRLIIGRLERSQAGWRWFDAYCGRHCCCSFRYSIVRGYSEEKSTEQSTWESRPLSHSGILYSETTIVLMLWGRWGWWLWRITLVLTKNKLKFVGRSGALYFIGYVYTSG